MAPCSNYSAVHRVRTPERDNTRLRKPVVEKMRRDRINGCIEQLKVILEKEFHQQEPNSKLEKADILEMTVSFLRQQLQPGLGDDGQGPARRRRDSVRLLSAGSSTEASVAPLRGSQQQEQQLHQARRASEVRSSLRATVLQDGSSGGPVWRPW